VRQLWRGIVTKARHIVSDDIIYAGSEMNVDTDEFLKSLKSIQVSRCECSAKNPDSDYPTSTRKPAPDSRRCTAGARHRPDPGQPHLFGCTMYKVPEASEYETSFAPWNWYGTGELEPTGSIGLTGTGLTKEAVHKVHKVHKVYTALKPAFKPGPPGYEMAYAQAYAEEQAAVHAAVAVKNNKLYELCTCDHRFGAMPHASSCALGDCLPDAAVTVAKLGPAAKAEEDTVPILDWPGAGYLDY
jgi:hypothetical protein